MAVSDLQQFDSELASAIRDVPDGVLESVDSFFVEHGLLGRHGLFSQHSAIFLWRVATALWPERRVFRNSSETNFRRLIAIFVNGKDSQPRFKRAVAAVSATMFYATSRPERFQLFNHMSASELFFVEGDSLVLEALSNTHVRLDAVQSLHVVYVVERYLNNLLLRGGKFHIVFFKSNERLWQRAPQLLAVRQVIQQRLTAAADRNGFVVKQFDSWVGVGKGSYEEYHQRHMPEFVLATDAEELTPGIDEFRTCTAVPNAFPIASPTTVATLRLFILRIIGLRTHIVFTSRMIFKDNDALGFVIRAMSSRFVPAAQLQPVVQAFFDGSAAPAALPALSTEFDALMDFSENKGVKLFTRDFVVLPSIAAVLKLDDSEQTRAVAKCHLIANAVCQALPLAARVQQALSSDSVARYAAAFGTHCANRTCQLSEVVELDEKVADMFDFNLVCHIARLVAHAELSSILGDEMLAAVEQQWRWIRRYAQLDKCGMELEAQVEVKQAPADSPTVAPAVGLGHDVVKKLLQRNGITYPLAAATDAPGLDRPGMNPFCDLAELDVPPGVKDAEEEARRYDSMTYREQKLYNRITNDFLKAIQKTAESMDVKPFLHANELLCLAHDGDAKKAPQPAAAKSWSGKKSQAKGMSQAQRIKKDNRLRKATKGAGDTFTQLTSILGALKRTKDALPDDLKQIDQFVKNCSATKVGDDDSDSDGEATSVETDAAAWKMIVGDVCEAEFVVQTTGKSVDVNKPLAAIDAFVAAQKAAAKKGEKVTIDVADDDTILRLKSHFFERFVAHLRYRALMESLKIARSQWAGELSDKLADGKPADNRLMIPLFQRLQMVMDHSVGAALRTNNQDRRVLRESCVLLGFGSEYDDLIDSEDNNAQGSKWRADQAMEIAVKPTESKHHTPSRFQMNYMGHLLQRPLSSTTDGRVPFPPDPWQVELLDIVDRNGSAIVCAPTSAGKTFISYYCMKKVLRESNDHIVVYVCPTRALINQALADVHGRYGQKSYTDAGFSGYQVFGCLGGVDYVKQPFKCQVLVTLPETFEAIMMSPRYQTWAKRIKYVIFDEIHSIEGTGNGDVWERLLMLVRCPFVALSATLGATGPVLEWLNGVQTKLAEQSPNPDRDYTVHLVPSQGKKINRWSDIQKYAFLPHAVEPFVKTSMTMSEGDLKQVHPMSSVTIEMLRDKFPEDLPFVPSETLHVYDTLVAEYNAKKSAMDAGCGGVAFLKDALKRLKPERYFTGKRYITQTEARQYETDVKELLKQLGRMSNGDFSMATAEVSPTSSTKKTITTMLKSLLGTYENEVLAAERKVAAAALRTAADAVAQPDTATYVRQNMISLLSVLKKRSLLPTLVFSFEESDCQQLVEYVVTCLENAEAAHRDTKEFRQYEAEMRRKAERQAHVLERMAKGVGKVREKDDDGNVTVRVDEIETVDEAKDYTIPEVLPQFSFRTDIDCLSKAEMDGIEYDLSRDDLVLRAYKRGIGMHTPDVKGKLRIHIERLFRLKHLPVVFATEGLALGVHSPCRSVVLAGDHVHLNTSQFRQMAGRAGRRGLDFLGHVVFVGISQQKIQRLLTSDLPMLKGHVHVDGIVELRMQQLHDYVPLKDEPAVDAKAVINACDCLLTAPLFRFGRVASADYNAFQLKHFATSLALFARMGLVHKTEASSLGSLVSRAMNTSKEAKGGVGAFMFAALVRRGMFHDLADAWNAPEARNFVYEHVLKTLCYLFTVDRDNGVLLEVHPAVLRDPTVFDTEFPNVADNVPHDVVLPGIKTLARQSLLRGIDEVTSSVLAAYTAMLAEIATEFKADVALPFADRGKPACAKKAGDSPLVQQLQGSAIAVNVRSPFTALSGTGDRFVCVEDMLQSLRSGLYMDPAHVPCVDFRNANTHRSQQILINAAVPDFIDTGSQIVNGAPRRHHLEELNGLRQDKSWYTLNQFMKIIDNTTRNYSSFKESDTVNDSLVEVLQEIVAQLEQHAAEISFKFPTAKAFGEAKKEQQTQKKAKRPALARERRR